MKSKTNLEKTNFIIGLEKIETSGSNYFAICIAQLVDHIKEKEEAITAATDIEGIYKRFMPSEDIRALIEDGIKYRKIKEAEELKNQ